MLLPPPIRQETKVAIKSNEKKEDKTKRKMREATSTTKSSQGEDKEEEAAALDVGQGKLYSPDHALKISSSKGQRFKGGRGEEIINDQKKMVVVNLRGLNLAVIKEKVLDKLAAASVPSDALENARNFLEGVVREVAAAAQGLTKDALHKIKTNLVDILPSLNPNVTRKMVDDAEKEANRQTESGTEEKETNKLAGKSPYMSPASSVFASLAKPCSRL